MDRRTLLKLMAAATAVGATQPAVGAASKRVVVAGAGIIGASCAYHLAKMGASVTVIDGEGPASHATGGTFAWINATWAKQPRAYHALNQESVAGWHTLASELNIPTVMNGSLEWFDTRERMERLEGQIAEQQAWGEPARMAGVDELKTLEPNIDYDGAALAAYSPNDGAVNPVLATEKLLSAAKAMGAKVIYPRKLLGVTNKGWELKSVDTDAGSIAADKLVLATGATDMFEAVTGMPLPQRSRPGVIVTTKPLPPMINRVVAAPGVHMHQRADGRIVLGEQDGAPDNDAHFERLKGRPNHFPARDIALEHAGRIMAIAELYLPSIAGAEVDSVRIGWRPLPLDGHPVIGAAPTRPDVHVAVMHSGVSLAPIAGALTAHEVLTGESIKRLSPYRPDRAFKRIKRY